MLLAAIACVAVASGYLDHSFMPSASTFVVAATALAGLAWVVSFATEQLGERFGPDVTGLMQSTLGNLPELFVVIFALRAGETVVAQTSLVGAILANGLLVLGMTIVAGAIRSPTSEMRFSPRLPNDTATLMLVAVFIIVLVGLSVASADSASHHVTEISVGGAICLLAVYVAWVIPYVRSGAAGDPAHREAPRITAKTSALLLLVAGIGSAFVSEWFIHALNPAIETFHVSKAFAGIVIVAIAGNAVENTAGVVLAWKGQADLAISVVKNSVAQIAVFLFPLLVLVSMLLNHHLTFRMEPLYIGALALGAIVIWQVTRDGAAAIFEGVALIATYVVLAIITLYE